MRFIFHKALDRPVAIFGIRGKWLTVFLAGGGCAVVLGIIVGVMTTAGLGVTVAILGAAGTFVAVYILQMKISHRDLERISLTDRSKTYVERRETLCRILYERNDPPSWFSDDQTRRDNENRKQDTEEN